MREHGIAQGQRDPLSLPGERARERPAALAGADHDEIIPGIRFH